MTKPNFQAPSRRQHEQPANVVAFTTKAAAGGYDVLPGEVIRVSGPVPMLAIGSDLEGAAFPVTGVAATFGFLGTVVESVEGPRIARVGKGDFLSEFTLRNASPPTWYNASRTPVPSWDKEANQIGPDLGDRFRISQEGFNLSGNFWISCSLSTTVAPAEIRWQLIRDSDLAVLGQTPTIEVSVTNSPVNYCYPIHGLILSPNIWYRWEFERIDNGTSNIAFSDLSFHFEGRT